MQILTTGKGSSGSWQIRGVQLGGKVGTVKPRATIDDCLKSDVIVWVKRICPEFISVKQSGKPWIWDLVDFYPQPQCSKWSKQQAVDWVNLQIEHYKPDGIIWPNSQMMNDCGLAGEVIYHHGRQAPLNPVRERVRVVGYEGSEKYLGRWRVAIEAECKRRGWTFKTGVPLHETDICVAFRDGEFNGYAQSHWKSNVKLANCHITGTPFIGLPEPGYRETMSGDECFAYSVSDLPVLFDILEPKKTRQEISQSFRQSSISLHSVANQLMRHAATIG